MNDCITTTKQSTTKPCAYFLGYTVGSVMWPPWICPVTLKTCSRCRGEYPCTFLTLYEKFNFRADLWSQTCRFVIGLMIRISIIGSLMRPSEMGPMTLKHILRVEASIPVPFNVASKVKFHANCAYIYTYINTYILRMYVRTHARTHMHACMHTYIHTYIHTCLLLLISMLWHRQAIFESKGDTLSSSAECRIRTHQGLRHQIASRPNARWQTDWAIGDQTKNLNSTARPYDQRAFSPLDPTAVWHSHLTLAIYLFVVTHIHTYIHTYIHISWFNFDALAQGNTYKPTKEPINYRGPGGDRTHDLQTEATPPAASCPARTLHATEIAPKNATPMTCPWLHWTTDNLSGMHMVSISTPVCVNFELRPGAGDIHICWFNFDALAQRNAYKPTKEPINYRGPGGDRTHDLQTEATPPAASCPARTLHATEIAPKNATPMTCPWLHWTTDNLSGMHMVSISTPVCVNFELRPGAGDIHICWFNFDALAQGNAYKPTKEPINYRGLGGDRTHDLQTETTPPAADQYQDQYLEFIEASAMVIIGKIYKENIYIYIYTYMHACKHTYIHT